LIGGSGGGGIGPAGGDGTGGGGGGGAILIASSTQIEVTGEILAQGGSPAINKLNYGSGGAIRLVAPVVGGSGAMSVFGGASYGRIRIDTQRRGATDLRFQLPLVTSIGSMMQVFPDPMPRLDIIEAAGSSIPVGSGPVSILLPFNSSANRTVKIQASNFNDVVPIDLVLTPDSGAPVTVQAQIDNRASNPASVTVDVVIPANVQTMVHAWTR
jgi:hypothetical protein